MPLKGPLKKGFLNLKKKKKKTDGRALSQQGVLTLVIGCAWARAQPCGLEEPREIEQSRGIKQSRATKVYACKGFGSLQNRMRGVYA